VVLVTGEAFDAGGVSSVAGAAGVGEVGDAGGVEEGEAVGDDGDELAQPDTPTPASAMVSARNRSRSMRMLPV